MYEKRGSTYIHLDLTNSDAPTLYVSDAHNNSLPVTSEIAGAYKKYPRLQVKRVQLDKLKELQQSQVTDNPEANDYSAQQAKIIDFFGRPRRKVPVIFIC